MGEPNQPRQPKDMQGLLKFCLEATRNEDAPAVPDDPEAVLNNMDPERRQWLQEALEKMGVDVVEQLGNGIKILNSSSADLDDKEEALDLLEDWVGQIDMAANFHKIGGYTALASCLESPHPSLRAGAAHLAAECGQNNEYCQERFVKEGFLDRFLRQVDGDTDDTARVKGLYAVSCICREYPAGLAELTRLDGWSVVVRAVQSDVKKLRTKACFFLSAVAPTDQLVQQELLSMGMVEQLSVLLQQQHDETHEHVLGSLLTLVRNSEEARREAGRGKLGEVIRRREEELGAREEFQEEVEFCRELRRLCFKDQNDIEADR